MQAVNRTNRSLGLKIWAGMLIVIAFFGCDGSSPIKIGFVGGTSGRVADLGISGRDAAQLVVEECNHNGGIHGRQVQLIIKDDQQNPDMLRKSVRELIDGDVAAIVGPMTSDMAVAAVPLLNDARLIAVSPTATSQKLSGKDDYFFRVSATTREYATRSARYLIKSAMMKHIVATYDLNNRSFCENWLDNFEKVFVGPGREIVGKVGFKTDGGRTFTDITKELLASAPDGILIVANSMDAALICQQIRKVDREIPITLADWGATERLLELGGKAVEGVTVVQTFDRDSQAPLYRQFRKAYLERYHREPGFPGVYTCDATQVVLAALREKQSGQPLKEVLLAQLHFEGLQGDFSFDEYGDVRRSNASISIVQNNKFVVLE